MTRNHFCENCGNWVLSPWVINHLQLRYLCPALGACFFLLLLLTMLKHNLLLLSLASFLSLDLPGLWTSEYWDRILFPLTLVCSQMSLLPFPPFFAHFSLQNLSSQEAILYSTLSLCSSLERFLTWLSEFHFRGRAVSPKPCPFVQSLTFESYSSFFLNALQSTVHVIF